MLASSFLWNGKQYSPKELADNSSREPFPLVVMVAQASSEYKNSCPDFAVNKVFWLYESKDKERVALKTDDDKYISVPLETSLKFETVFSHENGPPTLLKNMLKSVPSNVKVEISGNPGNRLSASPNRINPTKYGILQVVGVYKEATLHMQEILSTSGELNETRQSLSVNTPLKFKIATGINKKTPQEYHQLKNRIKQNHSTMASTQLETAYDIALLSDGFKSLKDIPMLGHSCRLYSAGSLQTHSNTSNPTENESFTISSVLARLKEKSGQADIPLIINNKVESKPFRNSAHVTSSLQSVTKSTRPNTKFNDADDSNLMINLKSTKSQNYYVHTLNGNRKSTQASQNSTALKPKESTTVGMHDSSYQNVEPFQEGNNFMTKNFNSKENDSNSLKTETDVSVLKTNAFVTDVSSDVEEYSNIPDKSICPIEDDETLLYEVLPEEQAMVSTIDFRTRCNTLEAPLPPTRSKVSRSITSLSPKSIPAAQTSSKEMKNTAFSETQKSKKPKGFKTLFGFKSKFAQLKTSNKTSISSSQPQMIQETENDDDELDYEEPIDDELVYEEPIEQYEELPEESNLKWTSASQIPKDIKKFTISDISLCLKLLNLNKYVKHFAEKQVNGEFLLKVNKKMLVQSFHMEEMEAKQLVMFAKKKWRPK